jgi:formate-dependent nitrite reductase membrane component NrfD
MDGRDGRNRPKTGLITASSQVEDSYYGFPVIKPPHWRWLVIVYLFLGGIAGASYTIGTMANLVGRDRAVERMARYLSFAALIPCPLLLVLDLGRPDRFLHMLRIVKLKSPLSLGSWALSAMGFFASVSAGLQLLEDMTHEDRWPGLRRLMGIAALPFSLFLSGYTGILLAATNVPLWWRSFPFLSPTFVGSAYSTSLAALSLLLGFVGEEREDTARRLARAEAICLATELSGMTTIALKTGKIGRPLTAGKLGMIFWPVTYLGGVLIPLLLQLNGPVQGRSGSRARRTGAAVMVLTGGFVMRALMIFAGRESARRPEDYFAMTRTAP